MILFLGPFSLRIRACDEPSGQNWKCIIFSSFYLPCVFIAHDKEFLETWIAIIHGRHCALISAASVTSKSKQRVCFPGATARRWARFLAEEPLLRSAREQFIFDRIVRCRAPGSDAPNRGKSWRSPTKRKLKYFFSLVLTAIATIGHNPGTAAWRRAWVHLRNRFFFVKAYETIHRKREVGWSELKGQGYPGQRRQTSLAKGFAVGDLCWYIWHVHKTTARSSIMEQQASPSVSTWCTGFSLGKTTQVFLCLGQRTQTKLKSLNWNLWWYNSLQFK